MLLQSGAVVALGAVGTVLSHGASDRSSRPLLGLGLCVGALLTAIDGMVGNGLGVPLAGWSLLVFAMLAFGDPDHRLGEACARPGRLLGLAAVAVFALHWMHLAMPTQPVLQFGLAWRPFDLACAAALGWLCWARPDLEHPTRFLLAGTAAGLAATSTMTMTNGGATIAAAMQVVAVTPWALRLLAEHTATLTTATATAATFGLTCALRATALQDGTMPSLPGLDDPLLVLAIAFAAFGVALLQAQTRTTTSTRTSSEPEASAATASAPPTTATTNAPTVEAATPSIESGAAPRRTTTRATLNAHDLVRDMRTPLTSMLATAGLLSADAGTREHQLTSLQSYGRQLTAMLADIDDFERLLRGSVDLAEDTYDFPQIVRTCAGEIAPAIADRNVEVRVDVITGVPRWVQGDPSRVRQLLTRLLEHAAWQCTLGPLEVTVHADERTLRIVVQNRTQTATADDGTFGILFSRQLALTLGGELVVSSRDGGGIEYRLSLPKRLAPDWEIDLLEEDNERTAEAAAEPVSRRVQGKVLLVDDSADHQRLIGQMLAHAGADVTTASGGSIALHMLGAMKFDLVLLDMQMPDKDGYATVAELRARGDTTPVLAVTADTGQADVERALAAGCNGHLAKPIDHTVLVRTLAMHLPVAAD